jgi:ABC-type amino acid transport substrate-binding protein
MGRCLTLGALSLLLIGGLRCTAAADPPAPAQLRVGITNDYPPMAFKQDNEMKGVEADFAHQLSNDYGTKVELVETKWDDLIPALTEKKIDVIMSGMSETFDRKAKVDFAKPYKQVGQMALIRKADVTRLSDPAAMQAEGTRVGVEKMTTGEMYARQNLRKAKITTFDSSSQGIAALRKGELDYFVHDAPTIWRTVGRPMAEDPDLTGLYRPLTEEYLAWAVRKGDNTTKEFLDAAIAKWKENGTAQAILDRWIPVKKVAIDVNK